VLVMPSLWLLAENNQSLRGLSWALQPFRPRQRPMR
jgi:hypothetical protein